MSYLLPTLRMHRDEPLCSFDKDNVGCEVSYAYNTSQALKKRVENVGKMLKSLTCIGHIGKMP